MLALGGNRSIWLATGATDLRRGFNGLRTIIAHEFGQRALDGDVYVFSNRRHDLIKIFFFDSGGIWICAKRLEKGTFRWPRPGERLIALSPAELQLLLSGIDLRQTRARRWWKPASKPAAATPPPARPDDPADGRSDRLDTPPRRSRADGNFPPP